MQMSSRRIIGLCAMFALLAQGVAFAAAGVRIADGDEHCDSHTTMAEDCACCPDDLPMSDCATVCAPSAILPMVSATFPPMRAEAPSRLEQLARAGPDYLPLKPPPIPSR